MNRYLAFFLALIFISPSPASAMLRAGSGGTPAFVPRPVAPTLEALIDRHSDDPGRRHMPDEDMITNEVYDRAPATRAPGSRARTEIVPASPGSARAYIDAENEAGQRWFFGELGERLRLFFATNRYMLVLLPLIQGYVSDTPPLLPMLARASVPLRLPPRLSLTQLREEYFSHPIGLTSEYVVGPTSDDSILRRPEMRRLHDMGMLIRVWSSPDGMDAPEEQSVVPFMIGRDLTEQTAEGLLETEGDIEEHLIDVEDLVARLRNLDNEFLEYMSDVVEDRASRSPSLQRNLEHIEQTISDRAGEWGLLFEILQGTPQFGDETGDQGIQASLMQAYLMAEVFNWLSPRVFNYEQWSGFGLSGEELETTLDAQGEIETLFLQAVALLRPYLSIVPRRLGFEPATPSAEILLAQERAAADKRKIKYGKKRLKQKEKKQREKEARALAHAKAIQEEKEKAEKSRSASAPSTEGKEPKKEPKKTERTEKKRPAVSSTVTVSGASPSPSASSRPIVVRPTLFFGLEFSLGTLILERLQSMLHVHEHGSANLAWGALFSEAPGSVALDATRIMTMAQAVGRFLVKEGVPAKAVDKWLQTVKERCDHVPHRSGSGAMMLEHERDIARGGFLESYVAPPDYKSRGVLDDRSMRKLQLKISRLKRGLRL